MKLTILFLAVLFVVKAQTERSTVYYLVDKSLSSKPQ